MDALEEGATEVVLVVDANVRKGRGPSIYLPISYEMEMTRFKPRIGAPCGRRSPGNEGT